MKLRCMFCKNRPDCELARAVVKKGEEFLAKHKVFLARHYPDGLGPEAQYIP